MQILKGPAERGHVKKCQKVFRHLSTMFSRRAKNVKNRQKVFRHFSTIFAQHHFSGPFWEALSRVKARSSLARGYKFGCVCSYMAGHYPGILMTGHIGTKTHPNLYPLARDDCALTLLKRGCANSVVGVELADKRCCYTCLAIGEGVFWSNYCATIVQ